MVGCSHGLYPHVELTTSEDMNAMNSNPSDARPTSAMVIIDDLPAKTQRSSDLSKEERAQRRARARAQAGITKVAPPRAKTIASYTSDEERSKIEIPLQIAHTSARRILSEEEADYPCSSFGGIQGLLDQLNDLLGTSHSLMEKRQRRVEGFAMPCRSASVTATTLAQLMGASELTGTTRISPSRPGSTNCKRRTRKLEPPL